MRIYTEVTFEWDDKQNQLVETSSESFDYEGEMALCAGAWIDFTETGRLYGDTSGDDASDSYITIQYQLRKNGRVGAVRLIRKSGEHVEDFGTDEGLNDKTPLSAVTRIFGSIETAKNVVITKANERFGENVPGQTQNWGSEADDFGYNMKFGAYDEPIGENPYEKGSNQWMAWQRENVTDKTVFDESQWMAYQGEDGSLNWKLKPGQEELDPDPGDTTFGEGVVGKEFAESAIKSYVDKWLAIVDPDIPDDFQDELEEAIVELELSEKAVITAFGDFEGDEGALTDIEEAWETSKERLTGAAVYEDGVLVSEGTFAAGMREALEAKIESKEDIVTTREEQLETLREEGEGGIRAAEAKIGAAGFAATGVGRTAREVLAEEIGEEARGIDIGFTEDIEDVEEGYLTKTEGLIKGKKTALEDYESERDVAAKGAQTPWKTATTAYENMLTRYGAVAGEETGDYTLASVTGGTARQAEKKLADLQLDIAEMIELAGGLDVFDPFGGTGVLSTETFEGSGVKWAQELGWTGTEFGRGTTEGKFAETLAQIQYKPGEALRLFDPDDPYTPQWESESE